MQQVTVIKIEIEKGLTKEYTIKELTVKQILDLSQTNTFLGGGSKTKPGLNVPGFSIINHLVSFKPEVERIMDVSCDFKFEDLIKLAPSDIKVLYDGFQEVNQTFLDVLEKLGITKILKSLQESFMNGFSEPSAT